MHSARIFYGLENILHCVDIFYIKALPQAFFRSSYSLNHLTLFLTTFAVDRIMDSQDARALIPRPLNMLPYMIKGPLQM